MTHSAESAFPERSSKVRSVSRICTHLSIVYVTYTIDKRAHMRETERNSSLHVDASNPAEEQASCAAGFRLVLYSVCDYESESLKMKR